VEFHHELRCVTIKVDDVAIERTELVAETSLRETGTAEMLPKKLVCRCRGFSHSACELSLVRNHQRSSPSPLPLSLQERGYSSLTVTASDAPLLSTTVTRAKPAPSGFQAEVRRNSASPTGAPLTNQAKGGTPPRAFSASRASRAPSVMPRSTRAPSGGKAIFSAAVSVAAMVLGASLRRWRSGGGRSAVTRADKTPLGGRTTSTSRPRRAKASNRIGAATCRPISPGVGPLSGRPTQTAIVVSRSRPTASASRKP